MKNRLLPAAIMVGLLFAAIAYASITSQVGISFNATDGTVQFSPAFNFLTTASGSAMVAQPQTATTNWQTVNIGLAATADLMLIKNNDASNAVYLATTGTNVFGKLSAGRFAFIPVDPSATIYVKATNASVSIAVFVTNP